MRISRLIRKLSTMDGANRFESRICAAKPRLILLCALLAAGYRCLPAQATDRSAPAILTLTSTDGIDVVNGKAEVVEHIGRHAMRLVRSADAQPDSSMLAILPGIDFHNGTIEIDVAGSPRAGADPYARGFIGLAFRLQDRGAKTELIYIRPTNGRSNDQAMRNHAVQYVSVPGYPWEKLRKESPSVYEAYTDLVPDQWTHLKIVVSGVKAQLYVNNAEQPCLLVNDLKLGDSHGAIALWSHETTDGYFANLRISR
jgi:hypothetical protein